MGWDITPLKNMVNKKMHKVRSAVRRISWWNRMHTLQMDGF